MENILYYCQVLLTLLIHIETIFISQTNQANETMKTIKEKVLAEFPDIQEKVVHRLAPVGKRGFATLKPYLQLWHKGAFLCEYATTRQAYSRARWFLRIKDDREKQQNTP